MLSPQQFGAYRNMSSRERIAEMRELPRVAERALAALVPQEAGRRLQAADRIRRESIVALLEGLVAVGKRHGETSIRRADSAGTPTLADSLPTNHHTVKAYGVTLAERIGGR